MKDPELIKLDKSISIKEKTKKPKNIKKRGKSLSKSAKEAIMKNSNKITLNKKIYNDDKIQKVENNDISEFQKVLSSIFKN
ncbi:MAG: hypothetical protein H6630_08935 [Arcobacter sp.]|nr:hypothetical protein [Arcobacter sp.]